MFYGTLPADTQDFTQVLRGVGRNIKDIGRGVSYYPYDVLGAPVDIINMALQPVGLGSQTPVLGSDYLRNIAQSLGYAQPSTGSGAETAGRFGAALINPAAGARAVGQAGNLVTRGANISADKLVQMITQNPRATAMGVVDETAMPFMQAVAPKAPAPSLLEPTKSDIGFYSQLEAATIPLQNKGTGDQYLAQISKTAGVKPEEIQWTGLDEFLKGKKSVSKDEILNYLNTNRVDVKEVQLGGLRSSALNNEQSAASNLASLIDKNEGSSIRIQGTQGKVFSDEALYYLQDGTVTPSQFPPELQDAANRYLSAYNQVQSVADTPTKFSTYTLPGGENYREILLTLPEKTRPLTLEEVNAKRANVSAFYPQLTQSEYDSLLQAGEIRQVTDTPAYRSSHFDQPNILAHMRVNDRVVDGKKTLFIEEIQSDWHQAGRKKGYQTGAKAELPEGTKVFEPGSPDSPGQTNQAFTVQIPQSVNGRSLFYGTTREEALANAQSFIAQPSLGAVPDAPFKTSWHELTLKRAIQEASEKGYDQIAFTTGKTQAERYDLSKQVDSINVPMVNQDGTRSVRIDPTNGVSIKLMVDENGVVTGYGSSSSQFTGKPLDEVIGKEMAEKVMKSEAGANFSGGDLAIGGEGMKGFYDNILPKSLDKLAKKFDAKVGKTEMDGVEVWQMDITPKMRESVTTKGQPLFAVPAIGAGLLGAGMVQDEQMY
jgi:hypothetical protein